MLYCITGIKDPAGVLMKRSGSAAIAVAQQSGDTAKAMQLLRDMSQQQAMQQEDLMLIQLHMGDVQFQVRPSESRPLQLGLSEHVDWYHQFT